MSSRGANSYVILLCRNNCVIHHLKHFFKTHDVEIPRGSLAGALPHTYMHTFTCIRHFSAFTAYDGGGPPFTCAHFLKSLHAGLCRIWITFLLLTLHAVDLPAKYLLWKPFNLSDLDLFLFLPSVSFMSGRRHPSLTLLPSFLWWTLSGIWHRAPWCQSQI